MIAEHDERHRDHPHLTLSSLVVENAFEEFEPVRNQYFAPLL